MRSGRIVFGLGLGLLVIGSASVRADAPEVYEKQCKSCHSIKGDAGKFADKGGPLDGTGGKHDKAWFDKYIRDPKSVMPDAKMPKLKSLTDEQIAQLVDYMASLK